MNLKKKGEQKEEALSLHYKVLTGWELKLDSCYKIQLASNPSI